MHFEYVLQRQVQRTGAKITIESLKLAGSELRGARTRIRLVFTKRTGLRQACARVATRVHTDWSQPATRSTTDRDHGDERSSITHADRDTINQVLAGVPKGKQC